MIALLSAVPWYYRLLALLALAVALFGFGFLKGCQYEQRAALQAENTNLQRVIKVERRQQSITASAAAAREETRAASRIVYRTVDREVIKYVQASATDTRCLLDARWVQLHDAAALARFPDASSESDATPSGIAAVDSLATITSNYETCNDTRAQLIDLQTWLRQQEAVWDEQ